MRRTNEFNLLLSRFVFGSPTRTNISSNRNIMTLLDPAKRDTKVPISTATPDLLHSRPIAEARL
jgi:hypothetical protein